ncbi:MULTISPECIES: multidrug effflux MFS transporter [Streptomyces]|uniref:multidrug effflux MFS transporter n=1 Tax=Streptomyces TaxID=1883 RepID=UPI00163C3B82|nr:MULTISPECIES: multidrug effflux MFS transporter [Streptomyces]MBC2879229.1 multidrug effflux MFS transporter [Streptomyces sp. TYQ1024]UBI39799.1 multidrug effflux MFS transporter [Streptomyces mobaraensis]UKW32380.1 multidrug effflux MFS transporter [Streptomyces sp. TYQ1024]
MISSSTSTTDNRKPVGAAGPPAPSARTGGLLVVLGALTAVAPLATDMYVPGFPTMGSALHTGSSAIQLTMTAFLVGLVVGQLLLGPLSDSLGRRRPLLAGATAFVVFSLLCAVAPNVYLLVAARFLQGVAGAVGMVLARAVITDRFAGPDIPRYFAVLSQILGVAPVAAPVLGGAILAVSTWRAVFGVLALIGVLLLLGVLIKVPESLPPERRHSGGLSGTFRAMGRLMGNRPFMGYVLVLGTASAALFAYISGSSFVFEHVHGVSAGTYSLIFALNAVGMLLAGTVFARLARRVRLNTLLAAGVATAAAGALAQVITTLAIGESFAGTWITLCVVLCGIGMIFPAAMSLGQNLGRATPGAASALLGGLQFLCGAIASPLVGVFGEDSSLPMAAIMLASLALAVLALLLLVRPRQAHGEVAAQAR